MTGSTLYHGGNQGLQNQFDDRTGSTTRQS